MSDDEAERAREWNRLLLDAQDIDHAFRGLGRGVTDLVGFCAEHGDGGPQLSRPGCARALGQWRDRLVAVYRGFEQLERDVMNNLKETP